MLRQLFFTLVAIVSLSACQSIPIPSPVAVKHVEVNGVSITYAEQGNGVPVVFVHGSMSDRRMWEAQRPDIASRYRYIAYDQRYFGAEPWRDDGKNFNQMTHAADLVAFIQSLKAGPVHVVAWSYGGSVATLAASQHPELFRSLSLHEPTIGSLIGGTPEGKAAISAFGSAVAPIRAVANAGDALLATQRFWEFVLILPEGGFKHKLLALQAIVLDNERSVPLMLNAPAQAIFCDMVKAVTAPVLITIDINTHPRWTLAGQALQRCVPYGQLVVLPGSNLTRRCVTPPPLTARWLTFWRLADVMQRIAARRNGAHPGCL